MGNPFLLATDFTPTVTFGLVSGVHRYQYPAGTLLECTDCIQIATSINPSNSGGPLFSMDGEIIGINGRLSFEKQPGSTRESATPSRSTRSRTSWATCARASRPTTPRSARAWRARPRTANSRRSSSSRSSTATPGVAASTWATNSSASPDRPMTTVSNQYGNVLGLYPKGWRYAACVYRHENQRNEMLGPPHGRSEKGDHRGPPRRPRRALMPPGPRPAVPAGPTSARVQGLQGEAGHRQLLLQRTGPEARPRRVRQGRRLLEADGRLVARVHEQALYRRGRAPARTRPPRSSSRSAARRTATRRRSSRTSAAWTTPSSR